MGMEMFNYNFIIGVVVGLFIVLILYCLWSWNSKRHKAKELLKQAAYKNSFTKWLKDNWDEDNMLPPALDAEDAFVFLKYYLLGPDWYVGYSGSSEQIITEMTFSILKKYSKRFRKECEENGFK